MAALGTSVLTLLDHAKRFGPDNKISRVIEMLSETNEILLDMGFKEGNLMTGERTTIRTGLPSVYWRSLNQGVSPSKSTTAQVDEACAILEAWSECDVELAKLGGDPGAFRLSEARAFIEAMNQEMASTLFYGDASSSPEEFTGLAPRFSSTSATNGDNVLLADGSASGSDQSSIWLVVWGENTCYGIYPKGSKAGLDHEDLGIETVETSAAIGGTRMRAYRDRFIWKTGLTVKDWRYVVRIANIDPDNLTESAGADLTLNMIKALHRVPNLKMGRAVFYMNRHTKQFLDLQRRADVSTGGGLTYTNVDGLPVMHFRGVPVRVCDAITGTEDAIS